MNLTIANISTKVQAADLDKALSAIGRQVTEDFQPEWGISAVLRGTTATLEAPIDGFHDAIIYLGDSSQDRNTGVNNALGYHAANHSNIPYGFIYLDICTEYGEPWTNTLSHEVLELLGDPTAVVTVKGPSPKGGNKMVHYDLEVCDATQGDSYTIDSVTVSNFVFKSYFNLTGGSARTNYLNLPLKAFGVRPKGYFQYEDRRGSHQIHGELVTERQMAAKSRMNLGRRLERRKVEIE